MKYIKTMIYCCATLAFIFGKVNAQADSNQVVPEKDSIEEKINIAFREIDSRDLNVDINVLNPDDYINVDYTSDVTEGLSSRIGGLLLSDNIWGMENALVLIDGVPRNFDDIRLEEVDQITVLKGVHAVALYGSHAAKGVILITTKRGKAGGRKVKVWASKGIGNPRSYPKYLSSADYMVLYNEARVNDGLEPAFDDELISLYRTGNTYRYPNLDYYSSEYINNYMNYNNVNVEFNAGDKKARFYSNVGWLNNTTILNLAEAKNESDNRFNIRGNVDLNLNKYFSSSIDISAVMKSSRRGLGDYWNDAATILPYKYAPLIPLNLISADSAEVQDLANNSRNIIDGQYILGGSQEYITNSFADLYAGGYQENIDRILQITNTVDVHLGGLTEGLAFHTRFNVDFYNSYTQSINNEYSIYEPIWDSIPGNSVIRGLTKYGIDVRTGNQNIYAASQKRSVGLSMYFDYQRTFSQVHNVSAMLLVNGISINRSRVVQPDNNANLGLQLGYNYDHRYWVDFSGAVINSIKLPEEERTALSPTVSLAWLISSENFMSGSAVVDHLKLSASAGILNTDLDIDDYYLYKNIYSSEAYYSWMDGQFFNQATTSQQGANPGLSFVKRKEINVGVEALLFDRHIWIKTMYFINQMDGLPTQMFTQYPNYFSDLVQYTNYNSDKRSGLEMMLNFNRQVGELEFNLGINAIYANSKAVKRDELYADDYQTRTGKPVDAIFGLASNGFFADETDIKNSPAQVFGAVKPGDIKYVDQNGDNIVDSRDEVEIGKWIAPFNYGVYFSASFKGITLFVRTSGSNGGNGVKTDNYYWADGDDKYSEVVLDRWTEETRNTATYPRLSSLQNNNNYRYSDFWIYESDRFDLEKVQLSYDLLGNKRQKSFIHKLGIYISGTNLLTIAKNKDIMELEIGSSPQIRNYQLGLRANF
jgi:TonB-linked SusC/RagA family outer membrane protein